MGKRGMQPQQAAEIRAQKGLEETKLQKLRVKRGLSQTELGERSGVARRSIQCYEQRTRDIDGARIDALCNLCIALECKMEDIIEDEETVQKIKALRTRDSENMGEKSVEFFQEPEKVIADTCTKISETVCEQESDSKSKKTNTDNPLDSPIEELELTNRAYNSLKRAGLNTVRAVVLMQNELVNMHNIGKNTINEVLTEIERYLDEKSKQKRTW